MSDSAMLDFLRTHEEAFRSKARLSSLYSDFRAQRATNPDGYAANSNAWLHALTSASRAGLLPSRTSADGNNHLAFSSGEDLARALQTREWGRPLALGSVIGDAVERKELVPLREFLSQKNSVYARGWGVPSLGGVVGWGLRQLGLAGGGASAEDRLVVGEWVVLGNVEAAATALLAQASKENTSPTSRIYSRDLFETTFAHTLSPESRLTSTDFTILLAYLSRDKPVLSSTANTVKFKDPTAATPAPITDQDTSIAELRTLITTLTQQVDGLSTRVEELQQAAKAAVAAGRNAAAKSALRSKKLAETTLTTRSASLSQLEQVYAKIEQAADQVAMVKVMESSASVLRNLHKEVGGVEGVEGVVERLREEMEGVDEIAGIVGEVGAEGVDEVEVEDELEEMERVERGKREERERVEREKEEVVQRLERERIEREEAEVTAARLAELANVPGKEESGRENETVAKFTEERIDVDQVAEGKPEKEMESAS